MGLAVLHPPFFTYDATQYQEMPQLYLDKYCTFMLTSLVIVSRHPRPTHKFFPTCPLRYSCPLFNSQSKSPTRSGFLTSFFSTFQRSTIQVYKPLSFPEPQVTKSPVAHPLSVQQRTKCPSRNSFLLITIHFDGGVYPPPTLPLFTVPTSHCPPKPFRMNTCKSVSKQSTLTTLE